jgi:4-amino-4-deoxy-L-arabinose transferase-like glycosyltransferase
MAASPTGRRGFPYPALWLLILLALALRLVRLAFQPLWWDEGWSLYFATSDLGTMLELTAVDIHPPLYYVLLSAWIGLFGSSALGVRLLSVLIGTVTIPVLYAVGRRLLGRPGGLVAAFLLAISPMHVYYSQEVRMYGLVTLLGVAAVYLALRLWTSERWRWGVWLGYAVAASAALYTHYYAAFLLVALNLVVLLLWLEGRRRWVLSWLGAQAMVVLLYLPWVWYAGDRLLSYVRFKVGVEEDLSYGLLTYVGRHLAAFSWGHAEGFLTGWWWFGLVPLVLLLVLFVFLGQPWRRASRRVGSSGQGSGLWSSSRHRDASWILLAVLLLCGFIVNLVYPFNPPRAERQLLMALPFCLLWVASVLQGIWGRNHSSALLGLLSFAVVGLFSLGVFYAVPRYPNDDYRPVAARLRALGLPGDAVLCIQPWQVGYLRAYIPGEESRPALFLTPREVIPRERQLWAADPVLMAADLDRLLSVHGRLWLLDHRAMGRVLESQIEDYLVRHAYPVKTEWHGENTVLSFFVQGEPVAQPVTAQLGGWLALDGVALSPGMLEAGWDALAVDLAWRLAAPPDGVHQVGLRLVDGVGRVWAQRDGPPLGGLERFVDWAQDEVHLDRHGLLVPAGTPPGVYDVVLRVYRAGDGTVLPALAEEMRGVDVKLGTVRVARPEEPPPDEALDFEEPLMIDFGGRLRLLGSTVRSRVSLLPGEMVEVDLFWQALADPGEDLDPRLQLIGSDGRIAAELVEKPVAGTYPTAWWRAGELVRDPQAVPVSAAIPAGSYRLVLGLVRAADRESLGFGRGQTRVPLAEVQVGSRQHRLEPTAPMIRHEARLGTAVDLIGYDLAQATYAPGSVLDLVLHWHARGTPDRNYHVFVHLLNQARLTVAQSDGPPGSDGATLPTLGWLPGEYVVDSHSLQLPGDLPAGVYRLSVGLYDPISLQRPGEAILLDTPVVVRDP